MPTNVLSNVGLIFKVCEKSPKNTEVIGTNSGAVPWPITSVFPELKNTHSLLDCIHPVIVLRDLDAPLPPAPAPSPTPMPTNRPPLPPSSSSSSLSSLLSSSLSSVQPPPLSARLNKDKVPPPTPLPRGCCRDDAKRRGYDRDPWDVHGLVLERPHVDCWVPESMTTKKKSQPPFLPSSIVVPLPQSLRVFTHAARRLRR
jgi:hypothetical protein